jgi:hypothetical protein
MKQKELEQLIENKVREIIKENKQFLNEGFLTRLVDKFFDKVKDNRADQIINDMKKVNPKAAIAMANIKKNSDELKSLLKYDENEDKDDLYKKAFGI